MITYTYFEILELIKVNLTLDLITENLCISLTHICGIIKIINLYLRKDNIYTIMDIMERQIRQPCSGIIGRVQKESIMSATWTIETTIKYFAIIITFAEISSLCAPILDGSMWHGQLPFRQYIPIDLTNSINYWVCYVYVALCLYWLAIIIMAHDCLFIAFVIFISAHLNILKGKMEICCMISNDDLQDMKTDTSNLSSIELRKCQMMRSNIELNTCISIHQNILRCLTILESMFNVMILLQFATSLLIICLTGFQINANTTNIPRFMTMICYLCCVLLELLLYCWHGNEVIIQSSNLKLSAFSCNWMEANSKFCKTLHIFLTRVQKPMILTAGGLSNLSLSSFTTIISRSYSYIAVLNQMNQ
ncbi:odorant receptor 4-like [Cephus cinctus]|uniref:Odorant receptor n=1 Tax=Cephus cinctus TaxID=211228 RepID=A0AAJ7RID5_CEPCN|nr:odorant receptor 4-like [Cephus cinctus]